MQVPHFSDVDLSGKFKFRAALTDGGICQVFNGQPLSATFTSAQRSDIFKNLLDGRSDNALPDMIQGSGMLFRKTFWLDVGERYNII